MSDVSLPPPSAAASAAPAAPATERTALGGLLTWRRLKYASFTHSTIYLTLLTVWLLPGLKTEEMIFGLAHGIGWILMSLAALTALRKRVISLRLAVAIAVIGGIGPFVGSYEFVRQQRATVRPQWR